MKDTEQKQGMQMSRKQFLIMAASFFGVIVASKLLPGEHVQKKILDGAGKSAKSYGNNPYGGTSTS